MSFGVRTRVAVLGLREEKMTVSDASFLVASFLMLVFGGGITAAAGCWIDSWLKSRSEARRF
jgi:hypothetical protein